jgi:hypothetical protein
MTLLADALQPFIVRKLTTLGGRLREMTFADLITAPTAAYDFECDDEEQSISLDFRADEFITTALAADCCRFALASFQTAAQLQQEILQRDSVAWSLVKLYYSAFYAGHTLIRIFGESCSYFERHHVNRLNEMGVAFGRVPNFQIESGVYRCVLSDDATAIKCTKVRRSPGGAHESFWDVFGNRIRLVGESTLRGPLTRTDAQSAFSQIENLRSVLSRRTGYSWLSGVRNDLQYRHRFGVWFPAQLNSRERQALSSVVRSWDQDPMGINLQLGKRQTLNEFAAGCTFVISLCHAMLARLAERSSAGLRSFVRLGPMAFLNDIRPRNAA